MKMEEARGPATETNEVEVQIVDHSNRQMSAVAWVCCVPCYWLRGNNGVHRAALSAATLLVTSLLVASPFLFLISAAPGGEPARDCDVDEDAPDCPSPKQETSSCTRPACRVAANLLRGPLHWSAQPCTDFLSFACGRREMLQTPQMTADRVMQELLALNTSSGPLRNLGRFYRTCLGASKRDTEQAIIMQLEKLGGYLPISALGPRSVTPLLAVLLSYGSAPLLDVYWGPPQDPQYRRPVLRVAPPVARREVLQGAVRLGGARLPPDSPAVSNSANTDWDTANVIMRGLLPPALPASLRATETRAVLDLLQQLNQLWISERQGTANHNLSTLQEAFPVFQWSVLLSTLAISDSDLILVTSPEYFIQLNAILRPYPTRIVHNAMLVAQGSTWHGLLGLDSIDRSAFCSTLAKWAMPQACSVLYAESLSKTIDRNRFERVQSMFGDLKRAFSERVRGIEATLGALRLVVDAPLVYDAKQNQSQDHYGFNIFEELLQRLRSSRRIPANFAAHDTTYDNKTVYDCWAYPFVATAFYDEYTHSVVLPLSLLVSPFFDNELPVYLHYATIGNVLAEQIYRSLEKTPVSSEEQGFKLPLCVMAEISSRVQTLGGQESARTHLVSLSLSWPPEGLSTSDESLPGIALSPEQLFYVASAQLWCPKIEPSSLSNTAFVLERRFSETWKCRTQARPDRFKRCPGW